NYHRKAKNQPLLLDSDSVEPAVAPSAEQEEAFLASWRDDLLARTWGDLKEAEQTTGQLFYTVLRYRADHPEASSQEMAEGLSQLRGGDVTAVGVRQTLHRAREKSADLLLAEIAHALAEPTHDALEAELIELGLLHYCQPALQRRRGDARE